MQTVLLVRGPSTPSGVFGKITMPNDADFSCVSLELPWENNLPNVSCIPTGVYTCAWRWSNSHGRNVYHIENVLNRSNCEIHPANITAQLLGCIALGQSLAKFPANTFPNISVETTGIQHSAATVASFETMMGGQPFVLNISNA